MPPDKGRQGPGERRDGGRGALSCGKTAMGVEEPHGAVSHGPVLSEELTRHSWCTGAYDILH